MEELKDVYLTFIFSGTIEGNVEEIWKIWQSYITDSSKSKGSYWWQLSNEKREVVKIPNNLPQVLEDFIMVENFFLSKQLFHVGRDYTIISRFIPFKDIRLIFEIRDRKYDVEPTLIISLYRDFSVVTLLIAFHFDSISIDDLIYIKSLKWYSIRNYERAPKISIRIGNSEKKIYFSEIFNFVWNNVFDEKIKIRTPSESILDLIEIRDKEFCAKVFNGIEDVCDVIYGIVFGDEGYRLNIDTIMKNYCLKNQNCIQTRKYFKYYFAPTSILGLFSPDYPQVKISHAQSYIQKVGKFEPIADYISLVSDIPTLSDGMALAGEITLIRYNILKDVDLMVRKKLLREKSLNDLKKLKEEIATKISEVELLAKDILWLNILKTTDEMFGYKSIKNILQERFSYISSLITEMYNENIQNKIKRLTWVMLFLMLVQIILMLVQKNIILSIVEKIIGAFIQILQSWR